MQSSKDRTDFMAVAREAGARSAKFAEASAGRKKFNEIGEVVLRDGAISLKTKELIAITLGVAARCEFCIIAHVRNAIEAGVTREELVEALEVALLMGGGPNSAFSGIALDIYDQFKE